MAIFPRVREMNGRYSSSLPTDCWKSGGLPKKNFLGWKSGGLPQKKIGGGGSLADFLKKNFWGGSLADFVPTLKLDCSQPPISICSQP